MGKAAHTMGLDLPALPDGSDPTVRVTAIKLGVQLGSVADQLDILVDTLPTDVTPITRAALQEAARAAARALDIVRWCIRPEESPAPEDIGADLICTTHTRAWFFSTSTQSLREAKSTDQPEPHDAMIRASWLQAPGERGWHVVVDLDSSLLGLPVQVSTSTSLMFEWEVSSLRIVNAQTSLSPILRLVLRQLLLEALEGTSIAMPGIGIRPTLLKGREVASA